MTYTTLISTAELVPHLDDPAWAIVDCRFALADPERGGRDYALAHIAGAVYAHLNDDLAGPLIPGLTGRHPLPAIDVVVDKFSEWGIDDHVQVVVYDDAGGAYAARLWWMLNLLGHEAVAVLDGGWPKWQSEGRETRAGMAIRASRRFVPQPRSDLLISTDEVAASLRGAHPERSSEAAESKGATKQSPPPAETASQTALAVTPIVKLFDSRTADRYRGENETIDPIAGHIPGAISAPYPDNLNPAGTFRSAEELRARFATLLGETPAEHTAFYCGSGVTAAHNILALKHAGLGDAKLYVGSWSEWITNPQRPIGK